MTFPKRIPVPVTNGTSTLDQSVINGWNVDISNAMDAGSGGTYAPLAAIYVGGEGIDHVYLADIATLKAIDTTSLIDGALRWVSGFGRYILQKVIGAGDTEDQPMVVAPTVGTGRWFSQDTLATLKYEVSFAASGTWTCPRNLNRAFVEIWGGGGGGANGFFASSGQGLTHDVGGGGGGAGQYVRGVVDVVPTTAYTAHVGAGGAIQTDGEASFLGSLTTANGGQGGQLGSISAPTACMSVGGVQGGAGTVGPAAGQTLTGVLWPVNIGDGGYVTTSGPQSANGGASAKGIVLGGIAGTKGTDSTNGGGLGGGGGGSGPGGVGGNGGNGGNGTNSAAAPTNNGGNGLAAAANTGGGGGGGGGGGSPASGSGTGGTGGVGGSGKIIIRGYA